MKKPIKIYHYKIPLVKYQTRFNGFKPLFSPLCTYNGKRDMQGVLKRFCYIAGRLGIKIISNLPAQYKQIIKLKKKGIKNEKNYYFTNDNSNFSYDKYSCNGG